MVASSNQKIYGRDVQRARDRILGMRRNRPILIISGTHGTADGGNWVKNPSNGIVSRNASLLHPEFVGADIRNYQHVKGNIFVSNIKNIDDARFGYLLKHSGYDIILASCYSRNDSALRFHLGLEPVTSFVSDTRYAKLLQDEHSQISF